MDKITNSMQAIPIQNIFDFISDYLVGMMLLAGIALILSDLIPAAAKIFKRKK